VETQLVGQTLILFVLLLLPLLWIARRAARPLAALTQAARTGGPGQMPMITEAGPADVRDLTRAFNDLSARVRAMLVDKDRTLGAIGHDLRTPLASLRVRVERVEDEGLRTAMSATIAEMATMLDDIVALARAGQPQEEAVIADLAVLLAGLVADYVEMGQPVQLAPSGIVASARVRPAALRRALRNLIDNAVTYGGSAELGLEQQGDRLALMVSDRGPGVPEDRLSEMLEPFARAEESRNRATGGAGLGLALAKAIAESEGGELILANREGGGLVAAISLPQT
jgi:signal transduction histidine kinase